MVTPRFREMDLSRGLVDRLGAQCVEDRPIPAWVSGGHLDRPRGGFPSDIRYMIMLRMEVDTQKATFGGGHL